MADKLQQIRRRIRSVESTEKITSAMKLVSNARLRQTTNRLHFVQRNLNSVSDRLAGLLAAADSEELAQDFFRAKPGRTMAIVLSSSKGLCGNFNTVIFQTMDRLAEEASEPPLLLPVGIKVREHLRIEEMPYEDTGILGLDEFTYHDAEDLARRALDGFRKGECARAELLYTKYLNAIYSKPDRLVLLPFDKGALEQAAGKSVPLRTEIHSPEEAEQFREYALVQYLALLIYEKVCETLVCEHSARRTAMNNANDNANDMISKLSLSYNRARQAAITNEIIEIISGSEAQRR